jgi:predicted RNA methylase
MGTKKKRKKKLVYNSHKAQKAAFREAEIQEHGKLISLRPSKVFKSKKDYKRNKKVDYDSDIA